MQPSADRRLTKFVRTRLLRGMGLASCRALPIQSDVGTNGRDANARSCCSACDKPIRSTMATLPAKLWVRPVMSSNFCEAVSQKRPFRPSFSTAILIALKSCGAYCTSLIVTGAGHVCKKKRGVLLRKTSHLQVIEADTGSITCAAHFKQGGFSDLSRPCDHQHWKAAADLTNGLAECARDDESRLCGNQFHIFKNPRPVAQNRW